MHLPVLSISLADVPCRRLRILQWTMSVVILGATGLAVWLWWNSHRFVEESVRYEAAAERVRTTSRQYAREAAQAGVDLSDDRLRRLDREAAFASQLMAKRTFSWSRLLMDLEEAVPVNVSIGSVALNFKESAVALNGTALTLRDLTVFADSLEAHPAFFDVALSRHLTQQHGEDKRLGAEGARAVQFSLTVTYRPR